MSSLQRTELNTQRADPQYIVFYSPAPEKGATIETAPIARLQPLHEPWLSDCTDC